MPHLTLRVPDDLFEALNGYQERHGLASRSAAVKFALEGAIAMGADGPPDPPDRELLLQILGVAARRGSVPAIRLLLEEYRRRAERWPTTARAAGDEDEFDALCARRQQENVIRRLAERKENP
jgi:hypothetical protein